MSGKFTNNPKVVKDQNGNILSKESDTEASSEAIYRLFQDIWRTDRIPKKWKNGLDARCSIWYSIVSAVEIIVRIFFNSFVIKLPKKGDTKECNNWLGITLLPVISKVFTSVLLERVKHQLDAQLRKEQAGFRPGRSCCDQIFVLRNIIEQSIKWQSSLYLNFVYFTKGLRQCAPRKFAETLRLYGLPSKIIDVIRVLHDGFKCSVIVENTQTEWFPVTSGLKQGCMLSSLLPAGHGLDHEGIHQRSGKRYKMEDGTQT
ncbi:hypothetical protein FSP39_007505 [Pinctada imbricata]|uniref:Reverse transcriptase domain-containing protein n=1 Tax=Pinctada imbricata TaxID=66713 RepID=A0AA88YSG4_PINIB|nr:hypothetical protein FSP39_007505 [Pinctada imbricata]